MPRPKRSDAPTQDAKPDGMSQETWDLGRSIGNVAIAAALAAVDDGQLPYDPDAAVDMLEVNKAEEQKAFKSYLKLQVGIGAKLMKAQDRYMKLRKRSDTLFALVTGIKPQRNGQTDANDTGDV